MDSEGYSTRTVSLLYVLKRTRRLLVSVVENKLFWPYIAKCAVAAN